MSILSNVFDSYTLISSLDRADKSMRGIPLEYNEWFDKHSKDRMVIEYKQEKIEMENIERNEVDYEAWFKNHSKLTNKSNQ